MGALPFTVNQGVAFEVFRDGEWRPRRGVVRAVEGDKIRLEVPPQEGVPLEVGDALLFLLQGSQGEVQVMARVESTPGQGVCEAVITRIGPQEEARRFVRVEDAIPMEHTRLSPEEYDRAKSRFIIPPFSTDLFHLRGEGGERDAFEDVNPGLARHLQLIERKLDLILSHLLLDREGIKSLRLHRVSISGSGMRFTSEVPYQTGDLLEIKMVLPVCPPVALSTPAGVVWVKEVQRGDMRLYETGVRFEGITEDVRDEIIRYTFARQRELLRMRWEEKH